MAYSYIEYTGNGTVKTFTVPFQYVKQDEISLFVNGTETTDFAFTSANTVTLGSAPANGATVRIQRFTDIDSRAVDFVNGAVLSEEDLDTALTQVFNASQEAVDKANDALFKTPDGKWDAQSRIIKNVANAVDAGDAVSKGYLNYEYPKVSTVADNIASVNAVAPSISNVNTVAADIAKVNTVSANITDVKKVAAVDTSVDKVAAIDSKVVTAANNVTPINTVANAIVNVNKVGDAVANVNTAAQNITNVNTVAGSITNVNTAGQNISSINTVAAIAAQVQIVANNNTDVDTLAAEISKIQTVANDLNETVSEIEVVANNIATVEVVANNIAAVNAAYGNAQTASQKASEASSSATSAANSAALADADRIAAEAARDRAEGAADATTTNTVIPTQNITADGGTTYTIDRSVSYAGSVLVECAGVTQTPLVAYNVVSGNQLVFSENVPTGTIISVRWLDKESQTGAALALEWASKARNSYVSGSTEYSSKHHALVAADNNAEANTHKLKAEEWASKPRNTNVSGTTEFSAKHYALEAKDSADAADVSEANALSYKDLALQYRNEAQAFAASAGGAANSTPVNFTANGTQTDFALVSAAQNNQSIVVTVNAVVQDMFNAYTLVDSGSTLRFDQAPAAGSKVIVRYL